MTKVSSAARKNSRDSNIRTVNDSLERARKACKKAEDGLSNLTTSEDDQKRRRKRPHHFNADESDFESDYEEENRKKQKARNISVSKSRDTLPTRPTVLDLPPPQPCPSTSESRVRNGNTTIRPPVPDFTSDFPSQPFTSRSSCDNRGKNGTFDISIREANDFELQSYPSERTLKKILLALNEVKHQVRQNTLLLKSLNTRQQDISVHADLVEEFCIPLKNGLNVTTLETQLLDMDKYKKLAEIFSRNQWMAKFCKDDPSVTLFQTP